MATKTYEVDVGGKTYEVDAPDANTAWMWANQYHNEPLEQTPPAVPQKKPEAKTSLVRDVPGALIAGTGQLAELPGQLYGLATGDFDTPLARATHGITEFGQGLKSEGLRQKEAAAQQRIDAAGEKGFLSGAITGAKEYLTDPALLTSGILQTAPSLIGTMGGGALAEKGAQVGIKVLAKDMAEGAAKKVAERAAVAGGVGFGAVQQGADVGSNAYTTALSIPQESWDKNPEFKQRVQSGESSDDVKKDMALRVARETALAAGAISAATGTLLPNTIEKALLGKGVGGNLITRGLKSLAGEATQEGSEEGGGRLAQNIAMRQVNPDQNIMEGVGSAAGSAAVLGGIMGGGIGAISPGETAAATDTGAAPPPGARTPPPPNAPAPDAPAIRTVVFKPAAETEPVNLDILSEPDEDGIVFVRRPDGGVIQVPLSAIEPEAAPVVEAAPDVEVVPEAAPVAEPVAVDSPAAEPLAAVPIDVTEPAPQPTVTAEPERAPEPELRPAPEPELRPAPPVIMPTLPIGLSRATPDFNYGTNRFKLAFDNDLDKAVYIATSKTPSKARPKYLEWLDSKGISDPDEIKAIGTRIRADIKDNVRSGANPAEPMRLPAYAAPRSAPVGKIPDVGVAAPAPTPQPVIDEPTAKAAPTTAPTFEPTTAPENEPQVFTPELAKELDTYDSKLSKELVGKTVAGAMRHVANRSKSDFYKSIGNRVANMIDVLQKNGMKYTFSVAGERGGIDSNAARMMRSQLSKPANKGISIGTYTTDRSAFEKIDIGVRGKPLPKTSGTGLSEQTVIHEGLHAATQSLISMGNSGRLPIGSRAEKAVKEINELYETVIKFRDKAISDGGDIGAKAKNLKDTTNAFKDSHELVSWGLTNYDMQSFLKDVPVEGGNAFTKFVRIIGKMLGVGEKDYNALRRLIEISENLIPEDIAGQTEIAKAVVSPYAQGKAKAASVVSPSETVASEKLFNKQPPKEPTPPPGGTTQQPGGPQATPQINIPLGQEKFMAGINRRFADRLDRLHYVQRQIESGTGRMLPRSERTTEKASLFDSRAQARLDDLKRDYEDKIIKTMADLGISQNEADLYLLARTAPARNAKIAKRNPNIPDGGSGRTNAQAKAMMDDLVLTGRMPKMQKLGKLVDELVREKLKLQVEYGLLSQQQVDNWLEDEPFYVPLKGVALGEDMSADGSVQPTVTPTGRGFSITPKETKIAKGRSTLPLSPLANLMSDARGVIVRGERNRVGQSFLNDIANKFQSNAWQVFTNDNPDMTQVMNPKTGKLMDVPVQMAAMPDKYFVVKENGKPSYIKIDDPLLMRALTNGSAKEFSALNKFLGSTIGIATKTLSRLHTTLNPEFFVTNAFRDVQAAVFNILAEQDRVDGRIVGKKILKGFLKDVADPRNFRDLFKATYNHSSDTAMSKLLKDAKDDGALTGWIVNETPQEQIVKIEKALAKATAAGGKKAWYSTIDGLNSVKNAVEDFNSIFENTTRLAVYKNALEALEQGYISSGISQADANRMAREEAANMARNVTVDFNRKGELGPTFNALFAFANAAVQGNVQLLRSLGQNPLKNGFTGAQKLVGGIIALGVLQAAMGAGMSDDDDDGKSFYDKIPDYEKERNLIFMKPDGKGYIKIPLPYGYSFFHNLGANGAELISGKKDPGKFASSMFGSLMGNFSPLSTGGGSLKGVAGTAVPTVIRPFYDLAINENFFGGKIYNEPFDKNQAASSVSKYSTPEGYKAVAEFLNSATGGVGKVKGAIDVSPEAIQYLINQTVGGTGKVAFDLIDLGNKEITGQKIGVSDVPILRKVIGEPSKYADLGEYYDRVTKISPIEAQLKSSKGIERQAIREKFPLETNPTVMAAKKQAESRMRAINKRKKLITNRNMDGDERRDQMDKLNELQTKAYVRFNTVYNRVEKEERGR